MDPVATVIWAIQAFEAGQLSECVDHIADYQSWRFCGGYNPPVAWHGMHGDQAIAKLMQDLALKLELLSQPA